MSHRGKRVFNIGPPTSSNAIMQRAHVGEGGPVPPTNKQTKTDYVYARTMNDEGKVAKMYKVWNATWTLKELGWM